MLELSFPSHIKPLANEQRADYQFIESGLDDVWLKDWPMVEVEGSLYPQLPDPEWIIGVILNHLTYKSEPLNGDDVLFIRKRLGLRGHQLAERLEVERVEVSRWEKGATAMPLNLQAKLRAMCVLAQPLVSELGQ